MKNDAKLGSQVTQLFACLQNKRMPSCYINCYFRFVCGVVGANVDRLHRTTYFFKPEREYGPVTIFILCTFDCPKLYIPFSALNFWKMRSCVFSHKFYEQHWTNILCNNFIPKLDAKGRERKLYWLLLS